MNFLKKYANKNIILKNEVHYSCYGILIIYFLNNITCKFYSCKKTYFKFICDFIFHLNI